MAYSGRLVTSEGRVVARSQAPSCGISPTPCMKTRKPKGAQGPWGPWRELGAAASQGTWGVSFPPSQPPPTPPGQMLGGGRAEGKGNDAAGQLSAAPTPPAPARRAVSWAWVLSSLVPPHPVWPQGAALSSRTQLGALPRDLQVNLRVSAPLTTGQRQLPGQGPPASFVLDPAGRPRPVVVASLGPSYKLSVDHDGRQRPACLCPPTPFVFG